MRIRIPGPLRSPGPRTLALRIGGIALAIAAVAYVTNSFDLRAVAGILGQADPRWLVPVAAIIVGQFVLRVVRLRTLLPRLDETHEIGLGLLAGAMLVSNLANNVTPARVGDGVKCYMVSRRHRLAFPTVLGTLMLEHGIDSALLAIIAASIALALTASGPLYAFSIFAGVVGVEILAAIFVARPVATWFRRRAGADVLRQQEHHGRIRRAVHETLAHFAHGASTIRHRRVMAAALALGIVLWVSDGLLFWLAARSLGLMIDPLAAMFIASGVALAAALPGAPGNVGTHEYAVVATAAAVGLAGSGILALAFLVHAIQLVPVSIAGVVVVLLGGHRVAHHGPPPAPGGPLPGSADDRGGPASTGPSRLGLVPVTLPGPPRA